MYDKRLNGLKMEGLNERISNLDGIYTSPVVNIISFIIFVLSLKKLNNLSAKIQVLHTGLKIQKNLINRSQRYSNPDRNLIESQCQHCIVRIERNNLRLSDEQP